MAKHVVPCRRLYPPCCCLHARPHIHALALHAGPGTCVTSCRCACRVTQHTRMTGLVVLGPGGGSAAHLAGVSGRDVGDASGLCDRAAAHVGRQRNTQDLAAHTARSKAPISTGCASCQYFGIFCTATPPTAPSSPHCNLQQYSTPAVQPHHLLSQALAKVHPRQLT